MTATGDNGVRHNDSNGWRDDGNRQNGDGRHNSAGQR